MMIAQSTHAYRQHWSITRSLNTMSYEQLVDLAAQIEVTATALRRLAEVRQMTITAHPQLHAENVGQLAAESISTMAAPITLLEVAIEGLAELGWSGTDIRGADLRGAMLAGAAMQGAVFWDCDLRWADLSHADLRWASFWGADLRGANLAHADLHWASLWGAKLLGVQYTIHTVWPVGFAPERYGALLAKE
jgi:hypothetical protein